MALDLVSLTLLLYFSGGPSNPFAIFYLVNVALSAVLLPDRWCWPLTVLAIGGFASLFMFHVELDELYQTVELGILGATHSLQWLGFLVALPACALVIIYFITRVTHELHERERELREAETQRAHAERLEALATLAAGAGHELATPLSTIAVVANELSRHLEGQDVPQSVIDDVALIRQELDACRSVLNRMTGSAGEAAAEQVVEITIADMVTRIMVGVGRTNRVQVQMPPDVMKKNVSLPIEAVGQAIRGLIQNALDASPNDSRVDFGVKTVGAAMTITIRDHGTGMSPDVLVRAIDPFYTTKEPGQGMGMGLFLTKSIVERLGGSLTLESRVGEGTTAKVVLPTSTAQLIS
jgi:two-component system sensor histidine kinase RegB